jgi:hypothetical protein
LLAQSGAALPIARLTLQSEPGDWVGQGQSFDISYSPAMPGFFSAEVRRSVGPTNAPAELLFLLGNVTSGPDNTFAILFFGTDALGIPMQPGSYSDAQRADFASPGHPGLDVSFQNRGCNSVGGSFTVHEASFSSAAEAATGSPIESFSASFEQHCEGLAPALRGTFMYHAFGVPEPAASLLLALGAPWLARRSRPRRSASGRARPPTSPP